MRSTGSYSIAAAPAPRGARAARATGARLPSRALVPPRAPTHSGTAARCTLTTYTSIYTTHRGVVSTQKVSLSQRRGRAAWRSARRAPSSATLERSVGGQIPARPALSPTFERATCRRSRCRAVLRMRTAPGVLEHFC
jgi:hypothetical protein